MGFLTREQIIQARDIQTVEVACPEWADGESATVLVQQPSAGLMEEMGIKVMQYQQAHGTDSVPPEIRTWFVARTIVDESGARMFSDDDIELLRSKSLAPIQRIFEAGQKLGGLGAEEVDELKKN